MGNLGQQERLCRRRQWTSPLLSAAATPERDVRGEKCVNETYVFDGVC